MAEGKKCSDLDLIETGLSPPIFQGLNVSFVEGSTFGLDWLLAKDLSHRLNKTTGARHMLQRSGGSKPEFLGGISPLKKSPFSSV